ncbi:hypothetical protein FA95DRAFT_1401249 [Auriscalpium vulgare]|uniref:Uncharacterized protein n=1 Tax=Auriscalpium vulgare TaxID=40419 RepID=A0ACB8RQB4_9AGAM|nr:hypothetical protein FA95DRAFT_1401249 [Auriscalpium vulgare]
MTVGVGCARGVRSLSKHRCERRIEARTGWRGDGIRRGQGRGRDGRDVPLPACARELRGLRGWRAGAGHVGRRRGDGRRAMGRAVYTPTTITAAALRLHLDGLRGAAGRRACLCRRGGRGRRASWGSERRGRRKQEQLDIAEGGVPDVARVENQKREAEAEAEAEAWAIDRRGSVRGRSDVDAARSQRRSARQQQHIVGRQATPGARVGTLGGGGARTDAALSESGRRMPCVACPPTADGRRRRSRTQPGLSKLEKLGCGAQGEKHILDVLSTLSRHTAATRRDVDVDRHALTVETHGDGARACITLTCLPTVREDVQGCMWGCVAAASRSLSVCRCLARVRRPRSRRHPESTLAVP